MLDDFTSRTLCRRDLLKAAALGACAAAAGGGDLPRAAAGLTAGRLPDEPLDIGHEPQFLFDLHVVDCTWAVREKQDPVKRVHHAGRKHEGNPLLTGDEPSHFWVVRDPPAGLFRMWYQINERIEHPGGRKPGEAAFRSHVAYAESTDGLNWQRPPLDLFQEQAEAKLPRNCVLYRPQAARNAFDTPQIVEAPPGDRRGYRYLMLYLGTSADHPRRTIRLVGSHDGVRWDLEHDQQIADISSDHANTLHYDPRTQQYVLYLRAKHIYIAPGQGRDRLDSGQSRRGVARMTSRDLWSQWTSRPQTILVPDETDAANGYNYFYGLPAHYRHGLYWGFLQSFRMNDYMHAELTWSRDGIHFERLPWRPKLIEYGPDGSWDDTMILACPNWIEVGDEWWVYYNGWDGPHQTPDRTGGIGLAKFRKEGFVSLRGPAGGGVVCTRELRWPGGTLRVNADAREGSIRVRVSDALRKPLAGFNYDDGPTFTGDSVSHEVTWKGGSLDALRGKVVRLEFLLTNADLYSFRAT